MVKLKQKNWVAVIMMGWGVVSAADPILVENSEQNSVSMSFEEASSDESITSVSASISPNDFYYPDLYNLFRDDESLFDFTPLSFMPVMPSYFSDAFYSTNQFLGGGQYLGREILNSGSKAAGYFLDKIFSPIRIDLDDMHGF